MHGGRNVPVRDLLAGQLRQQRRVRGERPGGVAAQLVRGVQVAVAGQHGRRGGGVVGARRGGDPALARVGDDRAVLQDRGQVRGVVLRVPAVAQERVRQPGVEDQLLGGPVLVGQREVRVRPAEDARVRELRDARRLRRVDHRGVLRHAPAHLAAGDQQDPVAGAERPGQGLGAAVVRDAQLHAPGGEVGGLLLVAHHRDDLLGRDGGQQVIHDEAAERSGGSGDNDAHGGFSDSGWSTSCFVHNPKGSANSEKVPTLK